MGTLDKMVKTVGEMRRVAKEGRLLGEALKGKRSSEEARLRAWLREIASVSFSPDGARDAVRMAEAALRGAHPAEEV